MTRTATLPIFCLLALGAPSACSERAVRSEVETAIPDTTLVETPPAPRRLTGDDIRLDKELLYDRHTLADTYPYKDTVRSFQWAKIRGLLAHIENASQENPSWGILRNRKNDNGEAPLAKVYHRNAYGRIADSAGTERYQGTPLYAPGDTLVPERYGQDGSLVRWIDTLGGFVSVERLHEGDRYAVPRRYVHPIDTVEFRHVVFVDRLNQNIATLEKAGPARWLVRSMNPATTGLHNPPYQQETPLGIFVVQQKKAKMVFLRDGSSEVGGFAPWASRFSNGGYIHGVPVNAPRSAEIEFSPTLGTTPRSHMCVRNATSHARFVYDWTTVEKSLVVVIR